MTRPTEVIGQVPRPAIEVDNAQDRSITLISGHGGFHPNSTSIDVGFFAWEMETGEVTCDPVTFRMHGLPEDSPATMEMFLSRVPPGELPQVLAAMERMAQSSGDYQIEYRVTGPDGALRSMEARGRVKPGPDGRPARMMGLVMDTTAMRAGREEEERRLREVADRARRMRDFTASLATAVNVEAIIDAAREGIRAYGADSLILVAAGDGRLKVAASCGLDDDGVRSLTGLDSRSPAPVSEAIQWRSPIYLSSPQVLADNYPHVAEVLTHSSQQAWVALPVYDSRGEAGACLFGFPEPHDFSAEERAQLFAASGLLALSLERARMHEVQRGIAAELQRGVLPRGKLTATGLTIATRYEAATSGVEIGGDFYDVVRLDDGRVALVIGDVEGHNLLAAALMGRLRTTVHAYAREGHDPAQVLARTNQWLADVNSDPEVARFATCCLLLVDPATGHLAMCRAGHPPALLIEPGGQPRVLDCDAGLPLGIEPGTSYRAAEMRVAPGSLLALTTDGLLETDAGDYNLGSLLEVLRLNAHGDLEVLADDLLSSRTRPTRHGDDVALLLARLDTTPRAKDRRKASHGRQIFRAGS